MTPAQLNHERFAHQLNVLCLARRHLCLRCRIWLTRLRGLGACALQLGLQCNRLCVWIPKSVILHCSSLCCNSLRWGELLGAASGTGGNFSTQHHKSLSIHLLRLWRARYRCARWRNSVHAPEPVTWAFVSKK